MNTLGLALGMFFSITAIQASVIGPNVEREVIKKQLDAGKQLGYGSKVIQLAAHIYLLKDSKLPDELYEVKK